MAKNNLQHNPAVPGNVLWTACLAMAELPWCYRIVPKKIAGLEDAPTMYSDKILVACASSATFTALGSM